MRHKLFLGIGLLTLVLSTSAVHSLAQQDPVGILAGYRGRNRVFLVFAANARDPDFIVQRKITDAEQPGFLERDLVTIPIFTATKPTSALAVKYGVKSGRFVGILVGKDGHEAYRTEHPVPAHDLFARIDAMPMRRAEIRAHAGQLSTGR